MPLASDLMDEAAAMCGDRNKTLYTYDKLISLLRRAARDLAQQLLAYDIPVTKEETTSATITAGTLTYPSQPTDLVTPLLLWERPDGSTDAEDWVPMSEATWDPAERQVEKLEKWVFEEEQIKFRGATTDRKVLMRYMKTLSAVVDQNSIINVAGSDNFLSAKTASYAARFIGKNVSLGAQLNGEAQEALEMFLGIRVKADQDQSIRMLPYSMTRTQRVRR